MNIRKLNEDLNKLSMVYLKEDIEYDDDNDEEQEAALEEFELFVEEEIKPIADKLNKLLSLLKDIGADNRAESLEDVLDYLNL